MCNKLSSYNNSLTSQTLAPMIFGQPIGARIQLARLLYNNNHTLYYLKKGLHLLQVPASLCMIENDDNTLLSTHYS